VAEIQKLRVADNVWLDEIRWLSEKLPPADEAMLASFAATANIKTGEMKFDGFARSEKTIKTMDQNLRDATHRPMQSTTNDSQDKMPYTIRFTSSVDSVPEQRK
jgi:hypothetical protein